MIAITYEKPGEPASVLTAVESKTPTPRESEILVKMTACPIVPADLATIRGVYRTPQKTPTVPGYGGQGEVLQVGSQVSSLKVGSHVLILPFKKPGWTNGCWQEYICIDETEVLEIPSGVNLQHTPDFFNTALTAWVMVVNELNLGPGQTLLLTAAGSNVGRLILKLASLRGFQVIAVVRRAEQVPEIQALGAQAVICSSTEDLSNRVMTLTQLKGVDAVIDSVGGDITTQCFKVLSENGKMIVYGLLDRERNSTIDVRKMLFYNLRLSGFWLPGWWFSTDLKTRTIAVHRTMDLVKQGQLVVPIEKSYAFKEIKEAVAHAERPGNSGRVILVP